MSSVKATEKGVVGACPQCGQKNRIPFGKLDATAKCGQCHSDIPPIGAPIDVESEAAFDQMLRQMDVPIVVDYWAPWCPPCRAVAPEFEKVAKSAAGKFVVAKVDTQSLPSLGDRYRIQSIPAMLVFVNGKEVARTVGARPAAAIEAFVRDAVAQKV